MLGPALTKVGEDSQRSVDPDGLRPQVVRARSHPTRLRPLLTVVTSQEAMT
jgi:hypothetical protein